VAEHPRISVLEREGDIPTLVRSMGLGAPSPVLVLIGGASGLAEPDVDQLTDYLRRFVLPAISRVGAVVIDGGTDSGVMRAVGRTRIGAEEPFPLVGVVSRGVLPAEPDPALTGDAVVVEPNHTDLVVVPGATWGDEVPWLGRIATAVARSRASVTLLVNGGEIAYRDMAESLSHDRPVVVLAGSGRTADDVAAAATDSYAARPAARRLAESPLTVIVPYEDGPRLREVLDTLLGPAIILR
jgi:hypothetical protein